MARTKRMVAVGSVEIQSTMEISSRTRSWGAEDALAVREIRFRSSSYRQRREPWISGELSRNFEGSSSSNAFEARYGVRPSP